jgi:hypothetical protein
MVLLDALGRLLHFVTDTYWGSRLLIGACIYGGVIWISHKSDAAARIIGRTLQIGGILMVLTCLYAGATSGHLITGLGFWIVGSLVGLLVASCGVDILERYGMRRQQSLATVSPEMPAASTDTFDTGKLATPEEIHRVLGNFGIRPPAGGFED